LKFSKGDETYSKNIELINEQITIWEKLGLDLNSDIQSFNQVFYQLFQLNHIHKNPYNFGSFQIEYEEGVIDPSLFRCPEVAGNSHIKIYHFDAAYLSGEVILHAGVSGSVPVSAPTVSAAGAAGAAGATGAAGAAGAAGVPVPVPAAHAAGAAGAVPVVMAVAVDELPSPAPALAEMLYGGASVSNRENIKGGASLSQITCSVEKYHIKSCNPKNEIVRKVSSAADDHRIELIPTKKSAARRALIAAATVGAAGAVAAPAVAAAAPAIAAAAAAAAIANPLVTGGLVAATPVVAAAAPSLSAAMPTLPDAVSPIASAARTAAQVFDNQSFADEEIHSVFSDSDGKFFRYECLKNVKREGIPESVESGCSGLVFRKCIFSEDYSKWLNDLHNSVKFSYVDQKIDNLNVGDDNKEKLKTFKKKFASGYISDAINSRRSVPDKLQRSMGKIQGSLQVGGSGSSARSQQEQIGSSEVGRADSDYHATATDLRPQDPRRNDYIGDSADNLDQAGMSFYGPLDVPDISRLSDGPELPDASDIERRCLQIKMYLESIRHNVGFIINPPRPGPNHREHLLSGGKQFAYDVPLANYHVLKLQPTKEEFGAELAKWKLYKDENLLFSEYDKVKPVLGGKRRSSEKYSVKFKEL